ncbi:MAG: hypothetical protein GY749_27055 [Desulfobacteraceae bacterium]|nr:hypothetical protein [Desulfobacteraceae bacterium]
MCFLVSCIRTKEHIIINKDGSGRVIIESQAEMQFDRFYHTHAGRMFSSDSSNSAYLFMNGKESLEILFPGDSFKIQLKELKEKKYATGTAAEIEFADINDLLASPYGKIKSLEATRDEKYLNIRARTGLEHFIFGITTKDTEFLEEFAAISGQDISKKSEMFFEFKVTFPGKPVKGNGQITDQTSVWTIDCASLKDEDKIRQESVKIMTASCPSTEIAFSPNTPPRLSLDNFQHLKEQKTAYGKIPSREKIIANVSFIPHKLLIKRSFDISGYEYGATESYSYLSGVIAIQSQLAPQKWGDNQLIEIFDNLNNSLKPSGKKARRWDNRYSNRTRSHYSEKTQKEQRPMSFIFKVPDRSAQKIKTFKAEVEMIYSSGAQVVKIDKAIRENIITDSDKGRGKRLKERVSHPELLKSGVNLSIAKVITRGDLLMIFMYSDKSEASVIQFQVFDAQGLPWPTLYNPVSDRSTSPIIVIGKPEHPLSLALMVSAGISVKIPVELKDISLTK